MMIMMTIKERWYQHKTVIIATLSARRNTNRSHWDRSNSLSTFASYCYHHHHFFPQNRAKEAQERKKNKSLFEYMMKCINNKSYRIFPFESWRSWSPSGIQPTTSSGCLVLFVTFAPWFFLYVCLCLWRRDDDDDDDDEEGLSSSERKGFVCI